MSELLIVFIVICILQMIHHHFISDRQYRYFKSRDFDQQKIAKLKMAYEESEARVNELQERIDFLTRGEVKL